MIVKSMSADEVLKELQKDDIWILDRMKGLCEKNAKKLKSKFVKNNEILSVSNYVIPETKDSAVVFATKNVIELKGKEYASLNLSYYIKTGYGTFILPCIEFQSNKVVRYVEFSPHSIDRIGERLQKGFDVFFRDDYVIKNRSVFQLEKYEYNYKENEFVAHVGDAFIIVKRYGVKDSVKTVLSTGYLHSNQLKLKLESKIGGESYLTEVDRNNAAVGDRYLKRYKTSGILRGIA